MTKTMKTPPGELLKRKREKLKLSLNDIHDKTKVSLGMLKKIEQDDVPRDVPKVCLKGFIQSYCECVDLSGAAICNEIDAKEKKDKTPQTEKTQIKSETGENKLSKMWADYKAAIASWNWQTISLTLAVGLILLLWGYNIIVLS